MIYLKISLLFILIDYISPNSLLFWADIILDFKEVQFTLFIYLTHFFMIRKRLLIGSVAGALLLGLSVFGYLQREKIAEKLDNIKDRFRHEPDVEAD